MNEQSYIQIGQNCSMILQVSIVAVFGEIGGVNDWEGAEGSLCSTCNVYVLTWEMVT